jgi:hypothetical protein
MSTFENPAWKPALATMPIAAVHAVSISLPMEFTFISLFLSCDVLALRSPLYPPATTNATVFLAYRKKQRAGKPTRQSKHHRTGD